MKVALCCIGRMENQYAKEFIEHYKKLGFSKIFIYDNNHDGEEYFEDVLQDYIDSKLVEIINYRNLEKCQLKAYNDCYSKHKDEYDWFAFFDFDEFLVLEKHRKINTFLKQFKDSQCVLINWMIMDDNDLVKNDYRPLMERFTRPMDYDKKVMYSFPENNHVKSIVKGGTDMVFMSTPHVPTTQLKCCDAIGNKCDCYHFKPYIFNGAYIKHFITKTIEEYLNNKMKRGYCDRTHQQSKLVVNVDSFFKYNSKTEEKLNFIENYIKTNDLNIFINVYKSFKLPVTSKNYKLISTFSTKNDSDLDLYVVKNMNIPLDDKFYSEFYQLKYAVDNIELPKYVGSCHYRRYFNFLDDIPDLDEIFSKYDCIVEKPIIFKQTVKQQYELLHNIEDLYIVGGIIADKYPSYVNAWHNFINGNIFVPHNIFIMKKDDFKKYIEFIFGVLDEYIKIVGTDINKRIEDNKDKYLKDFYPNNTIEYQYRIGGYIGERLTNVFFMNNFKLMKTYPVIITEDKYKK